MAITQHAYQPAPDYLKDSSLNRELPSQTPITTEPVSLEYVSVSQLLGRDYIFIDANQLSLPTLPEQMQSVFTSLIARLELAETHTVIVTFTGNETSGLTFTRHDLSWHKHNICRVETFTITSHDQQEFMDMIWQCSTPADIA